MMTYHISRLFVLQRRVADNVNDRTDHGCRVSVEKYVHTFAMFVARDTISMR